MEESADWLALARNCVRCREILEEQRNVDNLLCSAWALVEAPPRSHRALQSAHSDTTKQMFRGVACVLVLATAVAIIAFRLDRDIDPRDPNGPAHNEVVVDIGNQPITDHQTGPSRARKTVVSSSTGLVIPIASKPDYTIVRYVSAIVSSNDVPSKDESDSNLGDLP